MQIADGLAIALVVVGAVALGLGGRGFAASDDLHALYWSVVGLVALRAASSLGRSGAAA
jgi:hypothetical protein